MTFKELMNKFLSSNYLYVAIAVVIALVILITIRVSKKKKLSKRISSAKVKINSLRSHPFSVDIAKMDAIARVNSSIKETAVQCKQDFDAIQINIKDSISLLQDCDELLQLSKLNKCKDKVTEAEQHIDKVDVLVKKLDEVLGGILTQSTLQRNKINELKTEFHDIKTIVNNNPNSYTFCWEQLDKITGGISHQFSDFEAIMDASKYDDAAQQADVISQSIVSLNDLVQKLPELITVARDDIPNLLVTLQSNYMVAFGDGMYLDHLNINGNIENINSILSDCLAKIKNCEVEGINEQLMDCESRINQMILQLEDEKTDYRQLNTTIQKCQNSLDGIYNTLQSIVTENNQSFAKYDLAETKQKFEQLQGVYVENKENFESLMNAYNTHSIPASTLLMNFKEIENTISQSYANTESVSNKINSTKTSEARARGLLSRFTVVLNESIASIRLSRLPNISSKYHDDIDTAEKYIDEIGEMLSKEVLDMDAINVKIEEAQNLIVSLYKNVEALIETTGNIEKFIVLCNKYRPYYPEIDSVLYSAELAYRNGEYTKACRMTAEALAKIDPQAAETLTASINNRVALQKEA